MSPDLLRYMFFLVFGAGVAFMLVTNVLAYKVLRPPKKVGFLWWHVSAISISFLCFGIVILAETLNNLGQDEAVDADWKTYVTALGVVSYTSAQVIIFNVERARYVQKKALEQQSELT